MFGQLFHNMPWGIIDDYYANRDNLNPAYGKQPGEVDFRYKGDPSVLVGQPLQRPSLMARIFAPEYSRQVAGINQQFQLAPLQAKQAFDIQQSQWPAIDAHNLANQKAQAQQDFMQRQSQWPVEDARQLGFQKSSANQQFETEKSQWPDRDKHVMDAKKAMEDAQINNWTSEIAQARQAGLLPPQFINIPDRTLAVMLKGDISSSRMNQEATARESTNANLPLKQTLSNESGLETQFNQNRIKNIGYNALLQNPQTLADIATSGAQGDLYRAVHGEGIESTNPRYINTLKDGQVISDFRPGYVSPKIQEMKDSLDFANSLTGASAPHLSVADNAGFRKLPTSIPIGDRPIQASPLSLSSSVVAPSGNTRMATPISDNSEPVSAENQLIELIKKPSVDSIKTFEKDKIINVYNELKKKIDLINKTPSYGRNGKITWTGSEEDKARARDIGRIKEAMSVLENGPVSHFLK